MWMTARLEIHPHGNPGVSYSLGSAMDHIIFLQPNLDFQDPGIH